MPEETPDFDELEDALRVVGYRARLEILHQLRYPKAIGDLRVAARQRTGGHAASLMARQSVAEHLQKLVDLGVVRTPPANGVEGPREFVVNTQRFYQIVEDFRSVGTILATRTAASMDDTVDRSGSLPPVKPVSGPRLVLAHGLLEGKAFPLVEATQEDGAWWIGRRTGCAVTLDYDPFVSLRNSAIVHAEGEWVVRDSGQSRNGTRVDWQAVDDKGHALRPGNIVGVGRSLLVFQDD